MYSQTFFSNFLRLLWVHMPLIVPHDAVQRSFCYGVMVSYKCYEVIIFFLWSHLDIGSQNALFVFSY